MSRFVRDVMQSTRMYVFGCLVLMLAMGSFIIRIEQCICSVRQLNKGKRRFEKCVPVVAFSGCLSLGLCLTESVGVGWVASTRKKEYT